MKAQTLSVPATLFAAGFFATSGQAAVTVDITATDAGTPIDLVGTSDPEFYFFSNLGGTSGNYALGDVKGNSVGENSATPYYPVAGDPTLMKTRQNLTDGYYGLTYSDNGTDYTGYALVDQGGSHISEIDTHAVPEPASWALMILGLGATGAALRQRRRSAAAHA